MSLSSKPASYLARKGKVDVRRDEDQNVKLGQIVKLLIDAGYYRARVKGLSPFDKIVGGMTWCIEVCNFDVDVDLLFHDSLTIGQKIALTERIVKVLPYMKCPYTIEPHQIQGLDAIHIYPVIKWLVTQAIETRAEYQDETRDIALNEFHIHYDHCFHKPERQENIKLLKYLTDIKLNYGPKKRFRKVEQVSSQGELGPMVTLLEYSESRDIPRLDVDSDTESIDEEDEIARSKVCEKMSMEVDNSTRSSSKAVSSLVENQIKDIAEATKAYMNLKESESALTSNTLLHSMEIKLVEITKERESRTKALEDIVIQETKAKQQLASVEEKVTQFSNEVKKSEHANFASNEKTLESLSQLLEAIENSKKSSILFKENCRQEADTLKDLIKNVKSELEMECDKIPESLLISRDVESKRLKKVKELLALKTREVEALKRIIDDVPGRAELSQYQKRFIELYNLVGAEHHQTLQFYNMYNALTDSRSYMEKESDILNSVLDNMEQGLSSTSSLEEYINQLRSIIDGVTQNKAKLESKRNESKGKRSSLVAELNRLQELQLHYARILHLFSQEISTNEILLERTSS